MRSTSSSRSQTPAAVVDPKAAAKAANLRYVSDAMPGITRHRAGKGFTYRDPDGRPIRDRDELARIRSLAVPPAWKEVWICPHPNGHLQAVGKDARGRKQYRYHARWREVRDETKFEHLLAFGRALPRIRKRLDADLSLPGLQREKVLAAVVRLMEYTHGRVGNAEYTKQNKTYGLTTLRDDHVRVRGAQIEVKFKGKHGILHHRRLSDARLAKIMQNCSDLPGEELFQYLDENGEQKLVTSSDVNDYLREISGQQVTAKYFRTWAATRRAVQECISCGDEKPTKKSIVEIAARVAERMGNTPAVCRKSYIHPRVFEAHLSGALREFCATTQRGTREPSRAAVEKVVLRLLAAEIDARA
jgi:DNA topoisomerase-1